MTNTTVELTFNSGSLSINVDPIPEEQTDPWGGKSYGYNIKSGTGKFLTTNGPIELTVPPGNLQALWKAPSSAPSQDGITSYGIELSDGCNITYTDNQNFFYLQVPSASEDLILTNTKNWPPMV